MFPRKTFLAATVLLGSVLSGHDLYLMPEKFVTAPNTDLRVIFHNGDGFPQGNSPVKPERLRNTEVRSRAGSAPFTGITAETARTVATVRVPGAGSGILTANTIPNFIELDPAKFESYLKHERLSDALKYRQANSEAAKPGRELYSKYVKSLIVAGKADDYYRERTGLTIEFVPEADPYSLRPGDKLAVVLLFRGAPAANVAVQSAWLVNGKGKTQWIGRTDNAGRIGIPVKASGPHRLHAIVMERSKDPKVADWESFWASLTFQIQQAR